jgi:arabinose-5-phosphate isomerase
MLQKSDSIGHIMARDIMSFNPKTIEPGEMAVNALDIMRKAEITQLVVAEKDTYLGILHLHDLVKEGLI